MSNFKQRFLAYARDESGAELIQFAIAGPVFLIVILGTLQMGWIYTNNNMLDHANRQASRQLEGIRAAYMNNWSEEKYREMVCKEGVILNCDNIFLDVRDLDDYGDMPNPNFNNVRNIYLMPDSCIIIMARAYHPTPIFIPPLVMDLSRFYNFDGGLVAWGVSTTIFRVHPLSEIRGS